MNRLKLSASLCLALTSVLLAACPGSGGGSAGGVGPPGAGGVPRLDEFCTVAGLPSALRQTVLVIDQQALQKAPSVQTIRTSNPELFQLVTGLAAVDSVQRGTMGAREHLAVYVAPVDGSAPKLAFSGCAPGFSADELRGLKTSATSSFLGSSPAQKASEAAERFQTALLGALVRLTNDAPEKHSTGPILDRSFTRSLQSVPQLAAPENGVPRMFFFTDLNSFAPEDMGDVVKARTQGFADADKARLSLGRAEVHVVGPKAARDPLTRDYASAFWLGSEGRLLSWGGATFNTLPPPPVKVENYSGTVNYPTGPFPAQLRLATDRNGVMVDSWFIVKRNRSVSTPLTGSVSCDSDQCQLTTDQGGFAQAWATKPGRDPEYTADMPLAGLRQLNATVRDGHLDGKVFDPFVRQIGSSPNLKSLDFKMTRMADARL